jgi:hypothetical protein
MSLTFNPGALPVAVLLLAFSFFCAFRRRPYIAWQERRRGRVESDTTRRLLMRLLLVYAVIALLLAAFALTYNFNSQ